MQQPFFVGMDLSEFWCNSEYDEKNYIEPYPVDETIASVEAQLGGYKLPASYIYLMRIQNGGRVKHGAFPTTTARGWAPDHTVVECLSGIGDSQRYSLLGEIGDEFRKSKWGYPDIGIYIGHTPSAGHQMIALDYRACGKHGEPAVVHVDQEHDYEIVHLADNFEQFILALVDPQIYEEDPEIEKQETIERLKTQNFSPILVKAFTKIESQFSDAPALLREMAVLITNQKGYFSLHNDPLSLQFNDYLFWLFSHIHAPTSFSAYLKGDPNKQRNYDNPAWELMIAFHLVDDIRFGFKTGGYAEVFIAEWWDSALSHGEIELRDGVFVPTEKLNKKILQKFKVFRERE